MRSIVVLGMSILFATALFVACGGDDGGCGSDNDCKGDRICVDSECVDPNEERASGDLSETNESDEGSGSSQSGDSSGSGEEAGTGGSEGDNGDAGTTQSEGGSGGAGGGFDPADEALEAACMADCDAMHLPECDEYTVPLDQCLASCLLLDASLNGYCFKEYENVYTCKAEGGYECLQDRPVPHASCTEQQNILTECRAEIPCRNYCETAVDEGCAQDESSCLEQCKTDKTRLESAASGYFDRLLNCWTQSLICENGRPSVSGCEDEIAETAWHVGVHDDWCSGYCWGAELLGCGSEQCENVCQTKMGESSCGSRYRSLLNCVVSLSSFNMICTDEGPEPSGSCVDEQASYDSCLETYSNQ